MSGRPTDDGVRVFRLPDLGEGLTSAEIVGWLVQPGSAVAADQPVVEVETAKAVVEIPAPYAGTVMACHGAPGETLDVGDPLITIGTAASADGRTPDGQVLVGGGVAQPEPARRRRKRVIGAEHTLPRVPADPIGTRRIRLTGAARTLAEKVTRSHRELPTATTWVDVDATDMLRVRDELAGTGRRPSLLAMLAYLCVQALRRYPELNATVDGNGTDIVRVVPVHLSVAVQTDTALTVPVLRDAHARGVDELDAELARLVAAARAGTLRPADVGGGTFTLNNYGRYGVDGAAPLLNHPEGGMLGVGRVHPRPWVVGGTVVARQITQLALTFDHRLCDGRTAAGFLRFVADAVERPHEHFGLDDLPAWST